MALPVPSNPPPPPLFPARPSQNLYADPLPQPTHLRTLPHHQYIRPLSTGVGVGSSWSAGGYKHLAGQTHNRFTMLLTFVSLTMSSPQKTAVYERCVS